jgi:hypothetical protein
MIVVDYIPQLCGSSCPEALKLTDNALSCGRQIPPLIEISPTRELISERHLPSVWDECKTLILCNGMVFIGCAEHLNRESALRTIRSILDHKG